MQACVGKTSLATLVAMVVSTNAAAASVSGQYLSVDASSVASQFSSISLNESALQWACTTDTCSLTGQPSVSLLFSAANGEPVALQGPTALSFSGQLTIKIPTDVVDPLGNHWAVSADPRKATIDVSIASQSLPAGDPQFATAYGQIGFQIGVGPGSFISPFGILNLPKPDSVTQSGGLGSRTYAAATVLGLQQAGDVVWGPGQWLPPFFAGDAADLAPIFSVDGDGAVPADFGPWDFRFASTVTSANYATPSMTDPRCQSLACMGFAPGTINVNSVSLNLGLTALPYAAAVPEAHSLAMMGLGLIALAWVARRKRG